MFASFRNSAKRFRALICHLHDFHRKNSKYAKKLLDEYWTRKRDSSVSLNLPRPGVDKTVFDADN
jgi:hypothetical protein